MEKAALRAAFSACSGASLTTFCIAAGSISGEAAREPDSDPCGSSCKQSFKDDANHVLDEATYFLRSWLVLARVSTLVSKVQALLQGAPFIFVE